MRILDPENPTGWKTGGTKPGEIQSTQLRNTRKTKEDLAQTISYRQLQSNLSASTFSLSLSSKYSQEHQAQVACSLMYEVSYGFTYSSISITKYDWARQQKPSVVMIKLKVMNLKHIV